MNGLYPRGHNSCKYYVSDFNIGFSLCRNLAGDHFQVDSDTGDSIVFLLEGVLSVTMRDKKESVVEAGNMFLVPQGTENFCVVTGAAFFIRLFFDNQFHICDNFFFNELKNSALIPIPSRACAIGFHPLPILPVVHEMLRTVIYYMESGIFCRHMHEIKQAEFLFLLRGFYPKEDVLRFLSPIMTGNVDFRRSVLAHYKTTRQVEDLAQEMNMGIRTFTRRFKESFGEAPYRWMVKRKAMWVRRDLENPELSIAAIVNKYAFASSAHFTNFCKKMLGDTPTAIRNGKG